MPEDKGKGRGPNLFKTLVWGGGDRPSADEEGTRARPTSTGGSAKTSSPRPLPPLPEDGETSALASLARATGRNISGHAKPVTATEPAPATATLATATSSTQADPQYVQALRQDAQAALRKVADPGQLEAFEQLLTQVGTLRETLPGVGEADLMRAALKTIERTHSVSPKQLLGIVRQYQQVLAEKHESFCAGLDEELQQSIAQVQRETQQLEDEAKGLEAEAEDLQRQARAKRDAIDDRRGSIGADQQQTAEAKEKIGGAFQLLRGELGTIQQSLSSTVK